MMDEGKVRFALALLEGRLHKAVGGKRCGCGACGHWVAVAARHAGLTREELAAVLPAPATPTRRRGRAGRPWSVRIRCHPRPGTRRRRPGGAGNPVVAPASPPVTSPAACRGSPLSGADRGHPVLEGHRSYWWSHHRRRATTAAVAPRRRPPFAACYFGRTPAAVRTARYRAVTQCAGVRAVAHIATALGCGSR